MIPDDFLNAAMLETEPVPKADGGQRWGALAAIVSIAAGLRLWRLDQNGFGNFYYAAAVRSMLESWSNFFFGSFDPAGFVTVDKPPVAIWIQAISAKLLGFRGVSLLLPEALMGTISVVLTYHLVRRVFGTGAGLLAGLMLAITPICVAVDRDNLPDSALVLVLLLAAWAVTIAAEAGRLKPLLLAAALVGVGFNIKMLAAFVVLPTFYLCYLVAAPVNWRTRLAHLTAATIVLVAVSLSWSIAVELTPKSQRPYIGGSRNDSALDLALGYNGLGRVLGGSGNFRPGGPGGPGRFPGAGTPPTKDAETPAKEKAVDAEKPNTKDGEKSPVAGPGLPDQASPPSPPVGVAKAVSPAEPEAGFPPGGPGPGTGAGFPPGGPFPGGRFPAGMPPMFGGTPGLLRFTIPLMAAQITWLFPIALIGAGVASARVARRWPIAAEHLSLLLWAGWLGTHWVVFSFAQGIFHEYYTTIMGPAVAALAGIGVVALYEEWRRSDGHHGYLPTALILTAAWQAYIVSQFPEIRKYLLPALGSGIVISAIGLVGARWLTARRGSVPWTKLATGLGLTAILIGPACWSLGTVIAPGNSMMPAANPSALTGGRDTGSAMPPMPPFGQDLEQSDKLIAFLRANHHGERILVAGPASMEIAPIIIRTGETAVSLGGFMGGDPVLTKDEFAKLVEEGQVRFVLIGGGPGGGMPFPPGGGPPGGGMPGGGPPGGMPFPPGGPGGPGNSEVMAWVREHGKAVDSKLWQADEKPEDAEPKEEAGGPGGPGGPPGGMPNFFRRMRRMAKLYDCKPELGLVQPADVTK